MKKTDIIFAIICGLLLSWLAVDFFGVRGLIFLIILPELSVFGLWLIDYIGKRLFIVRQIGRFVLAGASADIVDIKIFQLLFFLLPVSLLIKAISFLVATAIKYWSNKYWAFEKREKQGMGGEAVRFFMVTLVGLAIDVVLFYYSSKIKTVIPSHLWIEICIIFAAVGAAVWNFCGYKFLVFKK